ncbi:hypothetical protein [Ornithinimicrobium kibberense]|uniref:hypothetical protein n=1 Tax=Ornithinimicrobium kibberense TaxID=282060 RepID=UPI00362430B6
MLETRASRQIRSFPCRLGRRVILRDVDHVGLSEDGAHDAQLRAQGSDSTGGRTAPARPPAIPTRVRRTAQHPRRDTA